MIQGIGLNKVEITDLQEQNSYIQEGLRDKQVEIYGRSETALIKMNREKDTKLNQLGQSEEEYIAQAEIERMENIKKITEYRRQKENINHTTTGELRKKFGGIH